MSDMTPPGDKASGKLSSAVDRARTKGEARVESARGRSRLVDHAVRAYQAYASHEAGREAAALAYYGFLSVFPALLVTASLLSMTGAGTDRVQAIMQRVVGRVAPALVPLVVDVLPTISERAATLGLIGALLFLWTAIRVNEVLHKTLVRIFDLPKGAPWRSTTRALMFVALLVLVVVALLLLSMLLVRGLGLAPGGRTGTAPPASGLRGQGPRPLGILIALGLTFSAYYAVAILILTVLPGHKLGWKRVRSGALIASIGWFLLYTVGVWAIAKLFAAEVSSYYGVATSTITLLLVISLSSRILLYAAEWAAVGPSHVDSEYPAAQQPTYAAGRSE